ncbi:hypothetical protein RB653_000624 [Dictyostelium firmibasis]|uniref:Uncharacterized protein n=1 Tax=Dictyostelium firmibasis TaxID=79012 RepID=A0AAN7U2L3_9MYCE
MTISNYTFLTGTTLASPCDIPRNALLTLSPSTCLSYAGGALESTADLYSVTLCKYYLNSIISLSTTNAYGAVVHYTNLTTLLNNIDSAASTILDGTYACVNTSGQFTDLTASKYDTLTTTYAGYISTIQSLQTSCNTLKTAVTTTLNGITGSSDTITTVKTCYTNVINALAAMSTRFGNTVNSMQTMKAIFPTLKDILNTYTDPFGLQDDAAYMSSMNTNMISVLASSNDIYAKLYFYKRLRGVIF